MGANNSREPKGSKSQEDSESHDTYNYNWYSEGDAEEDDIWDYFEGYEIVHNDWLPAGINDTASQDREFLG